MRAYEALTWDHPRGYNALAAASVLNAGARGPSKRWHKQPLEQFESCPIDELGERYDLIVLDHPHVGVAAATRCLLPLEDIFADASLEILAREMIGATFESYRFEGRQWALP